MNLAPNRPPPLWLLALITISGTMAMHMFVPALPLMAVSLGATAGQAQMTISLYIVGLAVGQLFYGPLSDSFGRRPLLMAGLVLYALAGLLAAAAPDIHTLVGARLAQALGGCAGLALGRAIVRDASSATDTVRRLALLNLVMMVSPGLSPLVGSVVASALGWRAVFWLLAGVGMLTLVLAVRILPETNRPKGTGFTAGTFASDYLQLLRSREFVCFAVGGGCATTSMYAFIATAPFIFHTELHRPLAEVGAYLAILIFGLSIGSLSAGRLAGRLSTERLLSSGNLLGLVGALAFMAWVLSGSRSVGWLLAAMLTFTCGVGLTSPVALSRAVSAEPRLSGSAAGLYGFTQMVVGAVCTSVVSLGGDPALVAAAVLLTSVVVSAVAFRLARRG